MSESHHNCAVHGKVDGLFSDDAFWCPEEGCGKRVFILTDEDREEIAAGRKAADWRSPQSKEREHAEVLKHREERSKDPDPFETPFRKKRKRRDQTGDCSGCGKEGTWLTSLKDKLCVRCVRSKSKGGGKSTRGAPKRNHAAPHERAPDGLPKPPPAEAWSDGSRNGQCSMCADIGHLSSLDPPAFFKCWKAAKESEKYLEIEDSLVPEVTAMIECHRALEGLDKREVERVLSWLKDKLLTISR